MFRARWVSLLLGGAIVVAACGSNDAKPPASTAGTASPDAATTAATAPSSATTLRLMPRPPAELGAPAVPPAAPSTAAAPRAYGPAIAPYAGFGTSAAPGVFPRTVKHAMGETTIKAAPRKVVVLDTGEMDTVIELGLKPVGAIDWSGAGFPAYLKDSMAGVQEVGSIAEPNLEAIVKLAPDLILTNKQRHEKIYDRLAAIAPVVYGDRAGVTWRQNFQLYAQALGREEQGFRTIASYEEHVKKFNTAFTSTRPSVSVVRVFATNLSYYQRANFLGHVLDDLGLPRPASQNVDDFAIGNMQLETLGEQAQADLIVVSVFAGAEESDKRMQASALWRNLDAVKKGNVLVVDDNTWIAGLGYKAANQIIDDLAKHFKLTLR